MTCKHYTAMAREISARLESEARAEAKIKRHKTQCENATLVTYFEGSVDV